jgi:sigma-70-like protein
MSAAFQLPMEWEASKARSAWQTEQRRLQKQFAAKPDWGLGKHEVKPPANLAFYRKHTESLLRRYLYASTQVGRAPSILGDSVGRGWASSRPVRTFEDAVIFVLDIETCLDQLDCLDQELISRIALQEYTQDETAAILGMSSRTVSNRYLLAVDRLTEKLLGTGLLFLPHS